MGMISRVTVAILGIRRCPMLTRKLASLLIVGERKVVEEDETISLLPSRRGGLERNMEKPQRKVMWNDSCGNQLAEVLEYHMR